MDLKVDAPKFRYPSRWMLIRRRTRLKDAGFLPNEVLELQRVSLRFLNKMKILKVRRNVIRHVMYREGVGREEAIDLVYDSYLGHGYRVTISDYIAWTSDYVRGNIKLDLDWYR